MSESDELHPDIPPGDYVRVGGLVDRATVTLALYGDELDPADLTATLECDPSDSHRKGDLRPSKGAAPYSEGFWGLSLSAVAPRSPADLVRSLLARVPVDDAIWSDLNQRFRVQLRFGIFQDAWNRGFDLPADVIREVNQLGARLIFDIYANLGNDE